MPWKESDVHEERVRFVVDALRGEESMSALCMRYRVSRPTGYKWLRRYRSGGSLSSLTERSRRPRSSPEKTPDQVESRVAELRREHGWGSRKLRVLLAAEGITLGRSAIDRIIREHGLLQPKKRMSAAPTRFERGACNELHQMDFKGEYRLRDGGWCYPLTKIDDHSRYALVAAALPSQSTENVQPVIEACLERHGVPDAILVDHGNPWWSSTNGHGLTRLSVFLLQQGIKLIHSGIGHPQTQGKVERFHRTMDEWFQHHGTPTTLEGFADDLERMRCEYNSIRPHESLNLETPASRYTPSFRRYEPNPSDWQYPPGADVRKVAGNGCVHMHGRYRFVCHALTNQWVSCQRFQKRVLVSYRHMTIREIDLEAGTSRPILKPYGPTGH